MDPRTADLLARAEAALRAGTPPLPSERVPDGLAVAMPFTLPDGDPVSVFVVPRGHGLRLVDDGTGIPMLEASGLLDGEGRWKAALADDGFAYDGEACEVYADLDGTESLHARALAMGKALMRMLGAAARPH